MSDRRIRPAVIVGIDGSQAAIHAAEWAADEAVSRGVSLLMLAIIKATHPSAEDYHRDVAHAETSLQAARLAVEAMGRPVKVETDILRGPPGAILVSESDDAEMICVGSVGIGRYSRALLGSTATEVAEKALCPVAVIRSQPDQPGPDINWIVVAVSDAPWTRYRRRSGDERSTAAQAPGAGYRHYARRRGRGGVSRTRQSLVAMETLVSRRPHLPRDNGRQHHAFPEDHR